MPRPLRPFAGRWSLVAAVLLPGCDSEPASRPLDTVSKTEPSSGPSSRSSSDDEPIHDP